MGGFFCCFQKNPFRNYGDPSDVAGTSAGTSKTDGVETTKKQAKLDRKKAKKEVKARKKASKSNKKKSNKTTFEEDGHKKERTEIVQLVDENKTEKTDDQTKKDAIVAAKVVSSSEDDVSEASKADSKNVMQKKTIVVVADVHPIPKKFLQAEKAVSGEDDSEAHRAECLDDVQNEAVADVQQQIAEADPDMNEVSKAEDKEVAENEAVADVQQQIDEADPDMNEVSKAEDKEVVQSEDLLGHRDTGDKGEKEAKEVVQKASLAADAINEINDVTNEANSDVIATLQLEVSNKAAIATKPSAISINFEVDSVEISDVPIAECEPNEPDRESISDTSGTEATITSSTHDVSASKDEAIDSESRHAQCEDHEIQHEVRGKSDSESDDSSIDLVACLIPHPSEAVQVAFVARVPADKEATAVTDDALGKVNDESATEQNGNEKDASTTKQ